jgi:hypothetical protein
VNIVRNMAWDESPFDPSLPPPLCFTVPAGFRPTAGHTFIVSRMPRLRPQRPKLMMDPSDPTTWQRDYRFT